MVGMEDLGSGGLNRVRAKHVTDVTGVKDVAKPVTGVTICDWCDRSKRFEPKTGFSLYRYKSLYFSLFFYYLFSK
jgi:hypothetical protein